MDTTIIILFEIVVLLIFCLMVFGYICNIIKLYKSIILIGKENVSISIQIVLRIIGIFVFPLGALMGFID